MLPPHSTAANRAALEEHVHALTICDGRRIAARTIAMLAGVFLAKHGPPSFSSLVVIAEQGVTTIDRRRQIDPLIETDGRRTALAGQWRAPEVLGGAELHRVATLFDAAVSKRAAPRAPVRRAGAGHTWCCEANYPDGD